MTYPKTTWNDGTAPAINATNLNKIEGGIYDAHEMATGRCASLVVAANNSSAIAKQQADYVCDGTADQVEIQAAITAAGAGEVYFAAGTYNFAGYVTTVAGVTLSGPGATFFLSNSTNGQLIRVAHDDVTIRDITLDGNGGNQTSGNGLIEVTVASSNLSIDNIYFKYAWNAGLFAIGSSGNNRLDGLMMQNCRGKGFYNGIAHQCALAHISYANNIQISDCRVDDFDHNANQADGVKVIHATNVQISGLIINNITGHGVFVGYGSEDVQISNIVFTASDTFTLESVCVEFAADGITGGVGWNKRVSISDVLHHATAGGNNGLYLDTSIDLMVSNCVVEIETLAMGNPHYTIDYIYNGKFVNCTARGLIGDDASAFRIEDSKDISLSNCSVTDSPVWAWTYCPRSGIDILSSENTVVAGCTLRTLPTRGISLQSSSVKIDGCVFENMGVAGAGYSAYSIDAFPNTDELEIKNNTFILGAAGYTKGTVLESNNDNCVITDNVYDSLVFDHYAGAGCDNLMMRNNTGYITEKSGTATLANGTTSIVISHGLSCTPVAGDIVVTPIEAWGSMTQFYVDTYTSTQFTIHADQNPTQDVDFAWKAVVL
jgi:hypothetical protein